MSEFNTEAEAIAELSASPFYREDSNGQETLFVPAGEGKWEQNPVEPRKKGLVALNDISSFVNFVKSFKDCSTNIYIESQPDKNFYSAVAILNDHGSEYGKHGFQNHRASFTPAVSEDWKKWQGKNREWQTQEAFALFLERNIADLVGEGGLPSGSDVLGFVTNLNETRKVKYGRSVNLQNGMTQIEFVEEDGGKGNLTIFKKFAVGLRPFEGGQAYRIDAFLRYRIDRNSGEMAFSYDLDRPERVFGESANDFTAQIIREVGVPVYMGKLV